MKNKLLALLVLCASCSASKYMTYDDYQRVTIGEKISDVQVQLGRPYEVNDLGHEKQQYIYIERIQLGEKRELFRRYILTVEGERVVHKEVKEETTSPIQFIGG